MSLFFSRFSFVSFLLSLLHSVSAASETKLEAWEEKKRKNILPAGKKPVLRYSTNECGDAASHSAFPLFVILHINHTVVSRVDTFNRLSATGFYIPSDRTCLIPRLKIRSSTIALFSAYTPQTLICIAFLQILIALASKC